MAALMKIMSIHTRQTNSIYLSIHFKDKPNKLQFGIFYLLGVIN